MLSPSSDAMQTIWTVTRTQAQTPCNRCFAVAFSSAMRGRILEPGIGRYIRSLSLSSRTATTQRRDGIKSSPRSRLLSQLSSSSLITPSPSSTAYLRPQLIAPKTKFTTTITTRNASSSSNSRWKQRQGNDFFAREARVQGLKSRAAFKLLEMDTKYKLFKKSSRQMVVDLGFAPGSWSQVALERTKPDGYVLGIDLIPAQPPKGMNTIQGNFLSPGVQGMVKGFLLEEEGRRRDVKAAKRREKKNMENTEAAGEEKADDVNGAPTTTSTPEAGEMQDVVADGTAGTQPGGEATVITEQPSYIDMERAAARESDIESGRINPATGMSEAANLLALKEKKGMRLVDVVLSDMSAPWPQTSGFSVKSLSNPYNRMMNTSGNSFRDHVGSMDLCKAALSFASDTLKPGGHFVCKFYQGGEDKDFETKLKKMFGKVHREKPESSRSESKESFFVALRRKPNVTYEDLGFE
ncbi:O-ribose methyltransferase [Rhypophila sp. PSN 637]